MFRGQGEGRMFRAHDVDGKPPLRRHPSGGGQRSREGGGRWPSRPACESPAGRELLESLAGERVDPQRALALARALRGRYPPDLVAAALTQQALRAAARAKFSRADQMLFTRDGLEQASSDATARHSAARYAGAGVVADLCCGIGGSLAALAGLGAGAVVAVDRDLTSLRYARHNAAAYGARRPGRGGVRGRAATSRCAVSMPCSSTRPGGAAADGCWAAAASRRSAGACN